MKRFVADTLAASRSAPNLKTRAALRYLWLSIVVAPCLAGVGYSTQQAAGTVSPQQPAPRLLTYSDDVDSVVTWPLPHLLDAVPELSGLVPAESQEELAGILQKVGANVKSSFEDFPNTASVERISMGRETWDKSASEHLEQKFQYLALAHPLKKGVGLEEYRTNDKGEPAEPGGLPGTYLVTKGFASMSLHFHPAYQPDSTFRYLGRQKVHKRQTYVLGFAQKPGVARLVGRIDLAGMSIFVLAQGIAWIDSTSYQIVRFRTDLLTPEEDFAPKRQTTEIDFQSVHFKGSPRVLWLPREVLVTTDWRGCTYLNRHHYSSFKLFNVATEQKVRTPEGTPPEHHNPD
jgi:hypothetical protein